MSSKAAPQPALAGAAAPQHFSGAAEFFDLVRTFAPSAACGEVLRQHTVALRGVVAQPPRNHSAKLGFALLRPHDGKQNHPHEEQVQVVMNMKFAPEDVRGKAAYAEAWRRLGCGDLVSVVGHPGKTRTGTQAGGFSVFACEFIIDRMAPDPDRALRILLDLSDGGGERLLTATAKELQPEPEQLLQVPAHMHKEQEARRLLCSMLSPEHSNADVLGLLCSLAAPRMAARRHDNALATAGMSEGEAANETTDGLSDVTPEIAQPIQTSAQRLTRIRGAAAKRQRGLVVVLEGLEHNANVGAALRTCEGFGVATVCHIIGSGAKSGEHQFDENDPIVLACSKSASIWLEHRSFHSAGACATWLTACGIPSVGTTPPHPPELKEWSGQGQQPTREPDSNGSADIDANGGVISANAVARTPLYTSEDDAMPWGRAQLAVWFGNEATGLSTEALRLTATGGGHMTVPMLGMVESLNIAATVAVVLTEVTRQREVQRRQCTTSNDNNRIGSDNGGDMYRFEGLELEALVDRMIKTSGGNGSAKDRRARKRLDKGRD